MMTLNQLTFVYQESEDWCPEHPKSCQDDPLSSLVTTPDFEDRGHLDRENC